MALTARIAALAQAVGADIKALTSALAGKSDASHNHDSDYLGITAKAADSDKVDGKHLATIESEYQAAADAAESAANSHANSGLANKLDSSDYTAADVLAKVKTVDGAGSELDADTLDGQHAEAFARASHIHDWADITDPPETFPPAGHTHPWSDITGRPATANRWPVVAEVDGLIAALADKLDAASRYTDAEAVAAVQAAPEWHAADWDEAYGWGDHALAGYLKSVSWGDVGGKPAFATVATSGAYSDLSGKPSLGTSAPMDVPASGDAAASEVVKGDDSRLSNARAPTAHTHPWAQVTGKPAAFTPSAHTHPWSEVTGKPSTFTPAAHTHPLTQITDAGDLASLSTNASTSNFLRGDGTWATPPNTDTTYSAGTGIALTGTTFSLSDERFTSALSSKLGGIANGATANATDAQLRARSSHTGTQAISTISGLDAALDGKVDTSDARLSDSRDWTAAVVTQAEAQAGTSTTARKWTAQRVAQAISALGLKIGATASTAKAGNWTPTWSEVSSKPSTYPPSQHGHTLSEITNAGTAAAEDASAFDAAGTASTAVSNHESATDPHSQYVQKVSGKALSSNDYTNSDKSKLAAMPRIEIVSELPAQEDPDTLYLVFPDESS